MSTATSEKLTARELCQRLGVNRSELKRLISDGLPTGGEKARRFDAAEVDQWLIEKGLAEPVAETTETDPADEPAASPTQKICHTRAELARELGLGVDGERTIGKWQHMPDFPGRPGKRGQRDAYFPVDDIKRWRTAQHWQPGRPPAGGHDEKLTAAKRRLALLEIEREVRRAREELGELIDAGDVRRFFEQCIINTKAVMSQLPDEFLAMVPAELRESLGAQVHKQAIRRIDEAYLEIAQLLEGDTDPTDDDEEVEEKKPDDSKID